MSPTPVERLNAALEGRYRVERQIGQGGMATVYLADDLRHNRKVALKVLKPELAALVGADRFLTEIEVTANLQHPHILPLFDSGEADGFLFFVMPYIEGETLRDRLDREKQLPVDEAIGIARAVAAALSVAHEQGVIHRDIKPGNILLSRGEPLVADFGISLAVSEAGGARLTETGLSVGTPYYMSPEQATGDREITAASDVYALGCVLYEMLVGEPPYVGNTAQAVLGKILTEKPRSPTQVRAVLPPNVDGAVMRALEKLPADRFMSASGFVRALTDTGFRHGAAAQEGGAVPASRGRTLVTAGLAAATLVLLGTTVWGWMRTGPAPVVRFELTLPEGVDVNTGPGVGIALSPDGSRLVFTGAGPGGRIQLWQRSLDRLDPTPIPGTDGGRNPRFSPDGASVAFTAANRLTTVSLTGAPPLTLVTGSVPDGPGGLAWGSDAWVYFSRQGQGIWRVSENGGDAEEVTTLTPPEGGHLWLEALPDGKGILFTRDLGEPTDDEIAVLDLETGETRSLLQGAMARYARSGHIVYSSGEGTLLAASFDIDRLELTGPSRTLFEGVQVQTGSATYFALSETGTLIYRPGAGQAGGQPVWVGRDGAEQVVDPALLGNFLEPAVSPDGRRIAFQYQAGGAVDVWIYDLDQGTFDRLTFEGRNTGPFWSPDGREVGFSSDRAGAVAIYARPFDLSAETRLLLANAEGGLPLLDGHWTPDGGLVYRTGGAADTDLYLAGPRPDSTPVAFLDSDFQDDSPALSPDGRWLAYVSDQSGTDEVYVRPFPGPGGQTKVSLEGGAGPVWASARELIYQSDADQSWVSATVRTEPDFAVVGRASLSSWLPFLPSLTTQQFDVSPLDGRLLAIRASVAGTDVRDVVVVNWFHELRQRVGN